MRMTFYSAAVVVLLAGSAAFGQPEGAAAAKKPARFEEIVATRFVAWDADGNGALSPGEIDKACVDPKIKGAEAAAVAALKRIVRSDKYELPALTKEYLTKATPRQKPASAAKGDADREDSTERDGAGEKPKWVDNATPRPRTAPASASTAKLTMRPDFAARFKNCMDRIEKTDRSLFAGNLEPTIEHCHQGPLGDCFFVSVVGAAVKHDAAGLRKMIKERPASEGSGYTVKFGTGREVTVSPLTDAEIAISSTTQDKGGDEGLWLAVLEKAFGTSRLEDMPNRYETESATDAIAKGGNTATSIRLLTGHTTERIALKRRARMAWMEQYDVNKRLLPPPANSRVVMQTVEAPEKLAKKVREKVPAALKAGKIVATGTSEEKQPPGISGKHAYAVLAYDGNKDTLTLWNPHGNTFSPRGGKEPGLSSGYPTKAGVFELPVGEFVRIFNGVTIETEKEAGKGGRT
jgi:hypothetical protein